MALLDDHLARAVLETRDRLLAHGLLLDRGELDHRYESFAARFGPERLVGLRGPELLDVLGSRGHPDSLADWLETEGDPAAPVVFGEVRPSGRHCLGLWFDPEKGSWCRIAEGREFLRDGSAYVYLSVSQAVDLAESWRRRLLLAADLIAVLPDEAEDSDYEALQDELDSRARGLSFEPWAHKYLYLCFPDRLDQFHDPMRQRSMLRMCGQTSPRRQDRGPSPFLPAVRFVGMARELGVPMNHLCLTLEALFESERGTAA